MVRLDPEQNNVGILGGAFNPVHIGHLRLALEVLEIVGLDRVELLPTYKPPHKGEGNLLDFELRLKLLQCSVADLPGITVNPIESSLTPPSYTFNTLKHLQASSNINPYFILGCGDLLTLPFWKYGLELPKISNFIVADRSIHSLEEGQRFARDTWKDCLLENDRAFFPQGTNILFVQIPRLDISSSLIRQRWRENKSLDFLLPPIVRELLQKNKCMVDKIWLK